MGRKLNLSHLSEGECRQILDVIQRDFSIRQKEKERLVKLQKLVKDEEQKRLVLSRQKEFNEKYCICCFSSFGLIFNKRTECKSCGFFICRGCSVKPEGIKVYMCLGCAQQRELQVQVCEWFYGQIRNRFRRFGSAKVVRSLYKRDSLSSESFDHCSNDSGVDHQLSPPAKGLLSPEEASRLFMQTLEKQTGTDPDWLPLFRPQTSSVAVQAPEDVLSDVLDSRQALEDFVFNLPPEEEELEKKGDSGKKVRRNSGPKVVIMDPEGEPLSKAQEANRKVHFGDTTTLTKPKESGSSSSMTASGAAYHILSPIEEVLSSPELTADANGNKLDSSSASPLKDRASIDRLALGDDDKRVRADSSSTISPHDWDSGIHMSLCLSQDGGWEVSQSTSSGTDSVDGLLSKESNQSTQSESVDGFAGMVYPSLDANDTLDSLETNFNSVQSEMNTSEMNDDFISSSCILHENRQKHDEHDESMSGIEIEQLTLSRSSSADTLKTDDDDDIDGNLTMEEFLDQLTSLSLSATSESADDFLKDAQQGKTEADSSAASTDETLLLSSSEEVKKEEIESLSLLLEMNEEIQPLLGDMEEEVDLPQSDSEISPTKQQPEKASKSVNSQKQDDTIKIKTDERHFKCTKSHHHHSGRSHEPSARSKSPYRRSKSSDDFALSGRNGETRSKSNGNKSHRRDGDPNFKCTKESHHHGKHHDRSPSNRFIRYDSLPLVVEVFESDFNYHSHHHNHRDFRQFSQETDSNDSEPSNQVAGKTSRSGAKLVRAPHLSPKSSYEEDPTQSRQLSMESNTTEDTMPKSTSQSSGPTTPESRRDSQQLAGMSSENESLMDSSKEEQRSPDKPLHRSPIQQGGSRLHFDKPKLSPSGIDYPAKDNSIKDFIQSLHRVDMENYSESRAEHSNSINESPTSCQMELNVNAFPERSYQDNDVHHKSQRGSPNQLKSPGHSSPFTSPTQPSPGLPSPHASHKGSPTQLSPSASPTQSDHRASPTSNPKRLTALRKDIQELANLSKKVSITQEEMLQSAEEVLTSAHKMSSIQNEVEELENVLDSLERTVIGDSSSLYGSSSDNDEEVVGPKEQVVEDMQILERQLAYSNTEDASSEVNSASAVRMITTTALKLLSTTEDAMESHTASLASPSSQYHSDSQVKDSAEERLGTTSDVRTSERDVLERRSSEEEEMCACSSSDGSRPNSLTLDDALTRNGKHETDLGERNSKPSPHQSERSRNQTGVSFLHLHPSNGQDSPPIATLMCEMDEDVRNGNGFNEAVSPYQNGDRALLDDIQSHESLSPTDQRLLDMTLNLDEGVGMEGLPKDKRAERRRRERKLRKSTGYKTSPAREKEVDLLLYNEMAQLEEKVYLSAGKVFTLEDRLKILQERVNRVDRMSPEENIIDLEDKIALTIAQVAQSESQVAAVEAQISALQRSREQSTMDLAGYQADGKFATVSVAMCNLTSPEGYVPFTYGPAIQIQIPRERVDSPVDFTMDVPKTPEPESNECNNNKNQEELPQDDEVELEMGITNDNGDINGGQREPFSISKCEVTMALRPSNAVIIRYLQEGDDETVWPDYRFNRNKLRKHEGLEKKLKLMSEADEGTDFESEITERHISTLHMSIGTNDNLPLTVTDGEQTAEVTLPVIETEDRGVAGVV
ncbi:uncharacterized protein [Asterias amurensis]|uniref:uncharacterized protein isoform X3 n=1 Tax=Asterias amurensis TaxID=7602 RepID=UPI003AB24D4D